MGHESPAHLVLNSNAHVSSRKARPHRPITTAAAIASNNNACGAKTGNTHKEKETHSIYGHRGAALPPASAASSDWVTRHRRRGCDCYCSSQKVLPETRLLGFWCSRSVVFRARRGGRHGRDMTHSYHRGGVSLFYLVGIPSTVHETLVRVQHGNTIGRAARTSVIPNSVPFRVN